MQLSLYQSDTASLIHDISYSFTSKNQLTRWINEARRNCAKRTGCIRRHLTGQSAFGAGAQAGSLIPGAGQPGQLPDSFPIAQQSTTQNTFQTIPGVERYPFKGFANPYLQAQHAGCHEILEVGTVSISWGGSPMPALAWLPWEDMQAYCRSYGIQVQNYPYYWSVLNDGTAGEVWLYPIPQQACYMEWDVYALPSPLYSDDDFDAVPDGFSDAVKFMAAELVYLSSQKYLQAQLMENQFADHLGIDRVSVDRGKTSNFYATAF